MKELQADYLWDGSGEPDSEVVRLEKALARFRHDGRTPEWSRVEAVHAGGKRQAWFQLAAVAASALVIASGWLGIRVREDAPIASAGSWEVQSVAGAPKIGTKTVQAPGEKARLRQGQMLETDAGSQASLTVEAVGQVDVEPETRLRLVEAGQSRTWM